MKSNRRLNWLDLFRWAFSDILGKTYSSEDRSHFYDRMAFDFFHRDRLARYMVDTIQELFPDGNPYIAERAAGSGIVTRELYERGYTNIRATDLSESQLKVLEEKLEGIEVRVENLDHEMEGVADDSVDVIFQVGATRFMSRKGQVTYISEAARTLKNGGYVLWPVMWVERPLAWMMHGFKSPRTTSYAIASLASRHNLELVSSPKLIHGKMGLLTTTLLVLQKQEKTKQRNRFSAWLDISRKGNWKRLRPIS